MGKIWCTIRDREVENTFDCPRCSEFEKCLKANGVDVDGMERGYVAKS